MASMISGAGRAAVKYRWAANTKDGVLRGEALKQLLGEQVKLMAGHFNQMKGAAMKVGQMLSMYGEVFLPAEVNQWFKTLQNQSTPVEWPILREVLVKELGEERLSQIDIEPQPLASASLGQVHAATILKSGEKIVLKVQYPGLSAAIENDLKILKSLFKVIELLPQISHLDLLFNEIESMLYQELDYLKELELIEEYAHKLQGDDRFIVPKPLRDFSTGRVLAMSFVHGERVDSQAVKDLPLERRNRIAHNYLELYFKELFDWGLVQTDPHIGNYRVQLDFERHDQDRLVLFDFGAVRRLDPRFVKNYSQMIQGALSKDRELVESAAFQLEFLQPSDPEGLKNAFFDFCVTMVEPFAADPAAKWFDSGGNYNWGTSDIPQRLTRKVAEVIRSYSIRVPPREVVFLDRKTGGVFIFVALLAARMNARPLLESFLSATDDKNI